MKPFLDKVASVIADETLHDCAPFTVIFPNRRSILFFNHYYKAYLINKNIDKPSWFPVTYTITDYILKISGHAAADEFNLIYRLYKAYCKVTGNNDTLDKFYYTAKMILSDFNEVDTYHINAEKLFKSLDEWKQIHELFPLITDDVKKSLGYFSWMFRAADDELTDQQKIFVDIWKNLYQIYTVFKQDLQKEGLGYYGMISREVAENYTSEFRSGKLYVVGFNLLTECEKLILKQDCQNRYVKFFWDMVDILPDYEHEAASFIKQNIKEFENQSIIISHEKDENKSPEINLVSAPSNTAQVAIAAHYLNNIEQKNDEFQSVGIILCDESLLIPFLKAVPDKTEKINITMGFPVKSSLVHNFIGLLLKYQKNIRFNENQTPYFNTSDLINLLMHPYLNSSFDSKFKKIASDIAVLGIPFIDYNQLKQFNIDCHVAAWLINPAADFDRISSWLGQALQWLEEYVLSGTSNNIEIELLVQARQVIRKIIATFHFFDFKPTVELFYQILFQHLNTLSVPFEGEPLSGLQIMGLLESRNLDFDDVILLSANEGVIPRQPSFTSLIPQSVRKAFGLPVHANTEAIYSYYFYRLLNRSKRFIAIYNASADENNKGEPSRFLLQLKYETKFPLNETNAHFEQRFEPKRELSVKKHGLILEQLSKFFETSGYLSPSALKTYIKCPLEFFYRYIIHLDTAENDLSAFNPARFGSLFHAIMYEVYGRFEKNQNVVDKQQLMALSKNNEVIHRALELAVEKEMTENYPFPDSVFTGRNFIPFGILKKYVTSVMQADAHKFVPFKLISLEKGYSCSLQVSFQKQIRKLNFRCRIDRIDQPSFLNPAVRIVDYKTGDVILKLPDKPELFNFRFYKGFDAIFQMLCYCYIYQANNPGVDIYPSIYQIKNIHLNNNSWIINSHADKINYNAVADDFTKALHEVVAEIFDVEVDFKPADNDKTCQDCNFRLLCSR